MPNVTPDFLSHPLAGWAVAIGVILFIGSLFATGVIVPGKIMDMWKSAYENEREARREEGSSRDSELRATMATLIHMLKSFQNPGGGGG